MRHRNRLLSFLGARFKPSMTHAGSKLYQQGDDINNLYIVQKGMAAFVAPSFKNSIFAVIDPSVSDSISDYKCTQRTLKTIGYEDSIVNNIMLYNDVKNNSYLTH